MCATSVQDWRFCSPGTMCRNAAAAGLVTVWWHHLSDCGSTWQPLLSWGQDPARLQNKNPARPHHHHHQPHNLHVPSQVYSVLVCILSSCLVVTDRSSSWKTFSVAMHKRGLNCYSWECTLKVIFHLFDLIIFYFNIYFDLIFTMMHFLVHTTQTVN